MLSKLFIGTGDKDVIPVQGITRAKELLFEEWNSSTYGIVRLIKLFITGMLFFFPTIYIDTMFRSSKASVVACYRELYYLLRGVILVVVLLKGYYHNGFVIAIIIYLMAELILYHLGGALVWSKYSISPQRSFILTFISYAEATIAFAIFYLYWDCLSVKPLGATQALYFSLVTATTVGYGDMTPVNAIGQVIVMIQLSVFILFVLLFIATFVSRMPQEIRK